MSLKSLLKKIGNDLKADAKAVYHAIDAANGGTLSIIKESIAKSYQGFLDAKINNLILDMSDNNVSRDELIDFINSKSHKDREFMSNLIIKNLHADNRITIFILAKLWATKIKNGSLNYYESSLFTNINTFTYEDFQCFYELWKNKSVIETSGYFHYTLQPQQEFYCDVQQKLFGLGILTQARMGSNYSLPKKTNKKSISKFDGSEMAETLFAIL
ncbi:MAG: hypothetical protein LRY68_01465 [Sulfurospirillum sp.]|nr:hypothetical protein [Sulfurospirillum sp.]